MPQKSLSIQTVVFLFIWRENQFQIEPYFSSLFVTKSYTNRVPFFFICCGNHSLILPYRYLSSVSVAEILFKSYGNFLPLPWNSFSNRTILGTFLYICRGNPRIVQYLSSIFAAGFLVKSCCTPFLFAVGIIVKLFCSFPLYSLRKLLFNRT